MMRTVHRMIYSSADSWANDLAIYARGICRPQVSNDSGSNGRYSDISYHKSLTGRSQFPASRVNCLLLSTAFPAFLSYLATMNASSSGVSGAGPGLAAEHMNIVTKYVHADFCESAHLINPFPWKHRSGPLARISERLIRSCKILN